ncbi:hypothetical protein OG859_13715 [Streptomyces sp. NBC_00048]|uniref:hypothetical protein n=1 Tax=Streptomyces sp. NBC_00048 TaxID=2975628 RepID=UPI003246FE8B
MTSNSPNSSAACGFWAAGTSTLALGAGLLGAGPPPLAWGLAGAAAVAGAGLAVRRRAVLWAACGLSAAAGFGLLMDVVGLLFAQGVDDGAAAVLHALGHGRPVTTAARVVPRGKVPEAVSSARAQRSLAT